ncbi:MAG: hypothetical protein RLZZ369_460 [Pseudomonadota bacterium]
MRWRLLRRRLSISAPRMAVRSHLPWPVRWAVAALMLGFSAALALWAFEFGRNIAGLNADARQAPQVIQTLRDQLTDTRAERDRAQSIANTADSLLKAERVTQQKLTEQVKQLEALNQALKDDLGFFERLLPATGEGISVRGVQIEVVPNSGARYQVLVMQQGVGDAARRPDPARVPRPVGVDGQWPVGWSPVDRFDADRQASVAVQAVSASRWGADLTAPGAVETSIRACCG